MPGALPAVSWGSGQCSPFQGPYTVEESKDKRIWMNLNFEESQARQAVTGARVIERASSGEELEMSALHLPCLS